MFVSVRRYRNVRSVDEVKRRVEEEFVPLLRGNPGFQEYYLIDCGANTLTSISVFNNWEAVLASNHGAKEFIRKRLADQVPEPADAVGGEVIVSARSETFPAS